MTDSLRSIAEKLAGGGRAVFTVKVKTRAGRSRLDSSGQPLRAELRSAPEDGRANEELVSLLAKSLAISADRVKIMRGRSGRTKTISIL